jgi:hypothetical protein
MNNHAAIGYALKALQRLQIRGYIVDEDLVSRFDSVMKHCMDIYTEEEAEEFYVKEESA